MNAQQIADVHEAIMARLAKERAVCSDPDEWEGPPPDLKLIFKPIKEATA